MDWTKVRKEISDELAGITPPPTIPTRPSQAAGDKGKASKKGKQTGKGAKTGV